MISKATAEAIWVAYEEIEKGETLLQDVAEAQKQYPPNPNDPNRGKCFELGVPMSSISGHRLFRVKPSLAASVIRAHIADKHAELAEANEQARIELEQP